MKFKIIDKGLTEYTWNSVEIPDYIEQAYLVICIDVYQNLELIKNNLDEVKKMSIEWSNYDLDIFTSRDPHKSYTAKTLESMQE